MPRTEGNSAIRGEGSSIMDNDIEKIRSWIRAIGVSLVVGSLCMIILTLLEFSKYHTGTIADWPYLGLCLFFVATTIGGIILLKLIA